VGLEGGRELALGSPFDYRSAALIAVPEDIPEPGAPGYAKAVASAIVAISLALRDRVLALFTSNSAMETARRSVAPVLQAEGIRVLAQGPDGPPHRIMRALAETRHTLAMGAQSLWEGVDLGAVTPGRLEESGEGSPSGHSPDPVEGNADRAVMQKSGPNASIKALIMARLPFPVPTEPVVAARSELYEDGFNQYYVPEAVLRFRQGFGRLIRSRSDRGAFVVLDRRILTKQYGLVFQRALPKCTVRRVSLKDLADVVRRWNTGEEI
jgi:DNA polymerase-3 subunit epsilon/ATP-dependent DNA helicase DinG